MQFYESGSGLERNYPTKNSEQNQEADTGARPVCRRLTILYCWYPFWPGTILELRYCN